MATIEERINVLELEVGLLKARVAAWPAVAAPASGPAEAATDADLDGQWGDEPVRRDPSAKYWTGQSYVGTKLSLCPPDYLDALARYKDACSYMSAKDPSPEKQKYAGYDKRDAARARGWAARLRSGWKDPHAPSSAPHAAAKPLTYDLENDADEGDSLPF